MRVVFIQYGANIECARMMVASCKRFGYEVWQLSDEKSPEVPGVDKIERKPMQGPRMLYRAERLADLDEPYVLMDTDMLVAKDISGGFSEADASLSWRQHHNVIVKDKIVPMPYNGGLVFVKNPEFMRDCRDLMRTMLPEWQDWYGDQIALRDVAKTGKYKIRELDESWNYVPDVVGRIYDDPYIYHFKGLRKGLMPHYFKDLRLDK